LSVLESYCSTMNNLIRRLSEIILKAHVKSLRGFTGQDYAHFNS